MSKDKRILSSTQGEWGQIESDVLVIVKKSPSHYVKKYKGYGVDPSTLAAAESRGASRIRLVGYDGEVFHVTMDQFRSAGIRDDLGRRSPALFIHQVTEVLYTPGGRCSGTPADQLFNNPPPVAPGGGQFDILPGRRSYRLVILWSNMTYPLLIQDKPSGERWREVKAQALDTSLPHRLSGSSDFAVAAIGNRNVDFFVVDSAKRRRSVRFHMPLVKMLQGTAGQTINLGGLIGALAGGLGLAAMARSLQPL